MGGPQQQPLARDGFQTMVRATRGRTGGGPTHSTWVASANLHTSHGCLGGPTQSTWRLLTLQASSVLNCFMASCRSCQEMDPSMRQCPMSRASR